MVRVRLQVGVATAFAFLMVVMIGTTVALLYESNRTLALETAKDSMLQARDRTASALVDAMAPVGRAVKVAAVYVGNDPDAITSVEGMALLDALIDDVPQIYSIYFGALEDGAFYQEVRLPAWMETFGGGNAVIPDRARRVYRIIADETGSGGSGVPRERHIFRAADGETVGEGGGDAVFDPRERPWFDLALRRDGVVATDAYIFESTGRPGITFARKVTDRDGTEIGAVGADMTVAHIADILEDIRIGEEGEVFLMTRDGALLTHSRPSRVGPADPRGDPPGALQAVGDDALIAAAIERWREIDTALFSFTWAETGDRYLASVAPIPRTYGVEPILGFVVPERHFIGAIKDATAHVVQLSLVLVVAAVGLTLFIARFLSRQIRAVVAEADRISHFNLDGDFTLKSWITEVIDLSRAVSNMKNGLRGFGAYVPRDLVRGILSRGEAVRVGGRSQVAAILFTDIDEFTAKTEGIAPQRLMRDISVYFTTMERAIAAYNGTVDKYIGDAVMAFWNAPVTDPNHTANACRAMLACKEAERRLNMSGEPASLVPLHTRFGLHTDRVVAGNVGSLDRLQYTVLGAAVNLAARIETLNKLYGTSLLVSDRAVAVAEEQAPGAFLFRPVDLVAPVGIRHPIVVHELVGEKGDLSTFCAPPGKAAEVARWNACRELYLDGRFEEALAAFAAHRPRAANKVLVDLYIDRCRHFIARPPSDWDGVWHHDRK